jgi:hypothetical protein
MRRWGALESCAQFILSNIPNVYLVSVVVSHFTNVRPLDYLPQLARERSQMVHFKHKADALHTACEQLSQV